MINFTLKYVYKLLMVLLNCLLVNIIKCYNLSTLPEDSNVFTPYQLLWSHYATFLKYAKILLYVISDMILYPSEDNLVSFVIYNKL